jgi:endo-1,4-beta-xylanase
VGAATIKSFAQTASRNGLSFGSAVNEWAISNGLYSNLLTYHCSSMVAETSFKWAALERSAGMFDFSMADQVAALATRSNASLRGHTLVWHESIPAWAFQSDDFRTTVQNQLFTVMNRYRGRSSSWDVVNEAIEPQDGRSDGLRNSYYLKALGDGYVEWAFRAARQLDGSAQLVYNDYGCEGNSSWHLARRNAYLRLVRSLRDESVPIDAVGFQAHLSTQMPFDPGSWVQYLAEFRKLGLRILITELDVNDRASPSNVLRRDQEVADLYKRFLDATLSEPAVAGVVMWGITDASTWLRSGSSSEFVRTDGLPQRPLPFDDMYQPKLAAEAVQRALASAPKRTSLFR